MVATRIDTTTLREVGEFVAQRTEEEVGRAERSGDPRAVRFASGSRDLVAALRRDIDERPWARPEVGNYLVRTARLYREHPHYRIWWG